MKAASTIWLLLLASPTVSSFFSPLFGTSTAVKRGNRLFQASKSKDLTTNTTTSESLKQTLLERIETFQELQQRDGSAKIDFGVKGGELNQTSRAPQKVDYYAISDNVGKAADDVLNLCTNFSQQPSPIPPTLYFGSKQNGTQTPLHGTWKLLFTTAADASFTSNNSTRGTASVSNIVDGNTGKLTNVIKFHPKPDGSKQNLDELNVIIQGEAEGNARINLTFKYAKVLLNKFFGLPLFGKRLRIYIPVPGPFLTRCIVFCSRIVKFFKRNTELKRPPKAYFDLLYLDDQVRIQKTGEDNIFVQAKDSWEQAKPLMK